MRILRLRELQGARRAFDRLGLIPYDNAAKLMALGVIVPELEAQWAAGRD